MHNFRGFPIGVGLYAIHPHKSQSKKPNRLNLTFTMSHSAARLSFRSKIRQKWVNRKYQDPWLSVSPSLEIWL